MSEMRKLAIEYKKRINDLERQLEGALNLAEEAINDITIDSCNRSEEIVKEYNLRLKKLKEQGE